MWRGENHFENLPPFLPQQIQFQLQSFAAAFAAAKQTAGSRQKGGRLEREKKREYMERLTRELLAYDSEAVGEAVKCRLSGADPDKLKAAAEYKPPEPTDRAEIGEMVKAQGYAAPYFPPVFTAGLDSSRLVVSKPDYIRLSGIENPFTGQAL